MKTRRGVQLVGLLVLLASIVGCGALHAAQCGTAKAIHPNTNFSSVCS